jgi:hypothetical protein
MELMRFSHTEEKLTFKGKEYKATCTVRNELNGWRKKDEVIVTMPVSGSPEAYYPRKFPTGVWKISTPEYTSDPNYAPVKIRTSAVRRVVLWDVENGEYVEPSGDTQMDTSYLLHFAKNSKTTWGCIRLDSEEDALEIAKDVISGLIDGAVYIEVVI